ncbi:MAG TPA: glycosyltransferase [Puia sp.]|nr:glycosyltransferase [Puia sp.]
MQHNFIKNKDIVLFSFQPWESGIGFNFKEMAFELAKYNRVLFVNRAPDRNSLLRKKNESNQLKKKTELTQIEENLWLYNPDIVMESINWISIDAVYDILNKINNRRLAGAIKRVIKKLSFKDFIFINDNDFYRGLYQKEYLECSHYIFYIRDFLTIQPYFRKHGTRLEEKIIKKADLVVANSAYLANYAAQWNEMTFDIEQGCDLKNYLSTNYPMPDDIATINRPIIGYCGAVTSMRLDISVIEHIAISFPEYSIVFVGPVDKTFEKSKLNNYNNIHFTGLKKLEEIPAYISHFNICMNPQMINPLTVGNYPRKIDEYLVMGKPVVATATLAMEMFRDYVFLCKTKEDYVTQINLILSNEQFLSDHEKERRINFALTHSWENSIGMLGDAYHQVFIENKK